jgi:hypothetical protein
MDIFRLLAAGAFASVCLCFEGWPAAAQAPSSSQPVLKPAKARGSPPRAAAAKEAASVDASGGRRSISSCVAGWYRDSGMTQGEWRSACERGSAPDTTPQERALSLCLVAWEPATHMTRREWRAACVRSVQQNPGAFQR